MSKEGEARQGPRVEAAFRVRYRSIDQLVVALTHDLSRGGLFMRTERFLPINAVVRVHLELPDDGGDVPVICRVAYVRGEDEAEASGKPAGMGVEFLDLGRDRLAQIDRAVDAGAAVGPAAVDVALAAVLDAVAARGHQAAAGDADARLAVARRHARAGGAARIALRAATVDVGLAAVAHAVAAVGRRRAAVLAAGGGDARQRDGERAQRRLCLVEPHRAAA